MRALYCAFCVLFVCSCGQETTQPTTVSYERTSTVLSGYRFQNWETGNTVYALGLEGVICLDAKPGVSLVDLDHRNPAHDVFFVEAVGRLSERGSYGHMGSCTYLFEARQVVQDRELSAAEREALGSLMQNVVMPSSANNIGAGFDRNFRQER